MPTLSKAVLPGWGYYLSGNQFDDARVNSPEAARFLADLHQYDPSAAFQNVGNQSGSDGGGSGGNQYVLNYDNSKLPSGGPPAMMDMNQGAFAGFRDDPNASYAGHLFDSNAVSNDPNGYGRVTSPRNLNVAADNYDPIGRWGPAIIAMIASMGAAAPALAAGGGLSALGGGLGAAGSLTAAVPALGRAASDGDWLSALLSLAGPAGSAVGIPGGLTSAGTTLARLVRKPRPGG